MSGASSEGRRNEADGDTELSPYREDGTLCISVVIPSKNDGVLLGNCLEALSKQTRAPDEIIVVDGFSTDGTVDICAAAGVRVVNPAYAGIFPATAAGFDAARGRILARLDADSVPPPDWVERLERTFAAADAPTAVTGPGVFYGVGRIRSWVGARLYLGGYFAAIGLLLGHPPLFGSNLAITAEAWKRVRAHANWKLATVHDDFDLSYHLQPDMSVRFDPDLKVGVSGRPLGSWQSLRRRLGMSYRTFVVDFSDEPPFERRIRRAKWSRQHGVKRNVLGDRQRRN